MARSDAESLRCIEAPSLDEAERRGAELGRRNRCGDAGCLAFNSHRHIAESHILAAKWQSAGPLDSMSQRFRPTVDGYVVPEDIDAAFREAPTDERYRC